MAGRAGAAAAAVREQPLGVYRSLKNDFARWREQRHGGGAGAAVAAPWDGGEDQALMEDEDEGMELPSRHVGLPPEWVDEKDAVTELLETVRIKMARLSALHEDHITKPSFDAEMEQEQEIEIQTSSITSDFHKCQKLIQVLNRKSKTSPSAQQKRLAANVVQSLAKEVQTLSMNFRKAQSTYLRRMQRREGRERGYLGIDDDPGDGRGSVDSTVEAADEIFGAAAAVNEGFTDEQIDKLKENTVIVQEREQEITNIVSSINELTTIFKDLAQLITEQGTILDRIDYNIEIASHSVEEGRKNLEKANTYQKKASKKLLIMLLVVICVGLFFGIIFKKKDIDPVISNAPTSQPNRLLRYAERDNPW